MARLIDADKVMERADEVTFMGFRAEERKKHFMDLVLEILKQPTVDAVEVVRCKDCKHFGYNLENDTLCRVVGGLSDPEENDFCSYGEKRDDR